MRKRERSAAAKALGRFGGLKGGPARAKSLTARRRKEIATKAHAARRSGPSVDTTGREK